MAHVEHANGCIVWFGIPRQDERGILAANGWQLRVTEIAADSNVGIRKGEHVLGLLDLRGADRSTLESLQRIAGEHAYLPLLAAIDDHAVSDPSLRELLRSCRGSFSTPTELAALLERIAAGDHADKPRLNVLVGQSPAMQQVRTNIYKYAPVNLPVLITGATGTGKEIAARALHALSPRRDQPFAPLNCGALAPHLVQSELFGHERGAFTGAATRRLGLFESANGGSVFLDEIGDLPLEAQTNLLRVLQEGTLERVGSNQPVKVDVRILAATHVDLEQAVEAGRFRSDLFYRLNVLRLQMPRLADRGEDIELMAQHFLDRFREHNPIRARTFDAGARRAMRTFAWPGNVRELINRIQRAAVMADRELLSARDLELDGALPLAGDNAPPLHDTRGCAERNAVMGMLRECGFNVSQAARRLQVSRVTLYRLLHKHGLHVEQMR
ncbi:DNA-binding transcriptional response regulator, NtrC family, contains REC, AAA-type ATPase, and a Fis-type DNA-binding domains [Pseudoxanthomonas sp. GM95]|uniref:sigma-54 interaction domain-containing protein n=1 Tax=Pseudoxanthomonas sp. GM95 TaxID=1881043 RepID=UPI0008B8D170|nr:sigma-54 dependent transcriptional regulator [Pseudoxanthomonas sp. GM95]SEK84009.1 DNA-binding transcriptional response regulator, NtrC family, contains REC, AAA-type ATPase, and a Fis-type DNA-binding domains [Pseudoxanthomonas sp. GM95]